LPCGASKPRATGEGVAEANLEDALAIAGISDAVPKPAVGAGIEPFVGLFLTIQGEIDVKAVVAAFMFWFVDHGI
jgi:hypothetical protein